MDTVVLSSDEEENAPNAKKIKLDTENANVSVIKKQSTPNEVLTITIDDDEDDDVVFVSNNETNNDNNCTEKRTIKNEILSNNVEKSPTKSSKEHEENSEEKIDQKDHSLERINKQIQDDSPLDLYSIADVKAGENYENKGISNNFKETKEKDKGKDIEKADDKDIEKADDKDIEKADDKDIEKANDKDFEKADDKDIEKADDKDFEKADDKDIEKADDKEDTTDADSDSEKNKLLKITIHNVFHVDSSNGSNSSPSPGQNNSPITTEEKENKENVEKEDQIQEIENQKVKENIESEYKKQNGLEQVEDNKPEGESEKQPEINSEVNVFNGDDEFQTVMRIEAVEPESPLVIIHPTDKKFNGFLDSVLEQIKGSPYEEKLHNNFAKIRKLFDGNAKTLREDDGFLDLLAENIIKSKQSAAKAVLSYKAVLDYIKSQKNTVLEVSPDVERRLRHLEHTIKVLIKKIKVLEEKEIETGSEEESSYTQLDKYQRKIIQVYEKYCKLTRKNPHSGRITHEKLCFHYSNYTEINKTIIKSFKHDKFPNFNDVEKVIKKCVQKHNLNLTENEIKRESELCFRKLGDILQLRRRKELFELHKVHIEGTKDPAESDKQLDNTLRKHALDSKSKMDQIVNTYVEKQALATEDEQVEDEENSVPESDSD